MWRRGLRFVLPPFVLCAPILVGPAAAGAQPNGGDAPAFSMRTGVGWAFVVPDALLGAGAFHVLGETPWGLYADAKATHYSRRNDRDYQRDLTVALVESQFPPRRRREAGTRDEWVFLNLGVMRAISPDFGVIVGGGAARRTVIQEYADPTDDRLTDRGFYFVDDLEASGWSGNVVIIALLRTSEPVGFAVGFESSPVSISMGFFLIVR